MGKDVNTRDLDASRVNPRSVYSYLRYRTSFLDSFCFVDVITYASRIFHLASIVLF